MEIKKIELSKLVENNWNPNVMKENKFASLVRHVKEKGMVQPILIRPAPKKQEQELSEFEKETLKDSPAPEFEIIDGAHRFKAAKQAGLEQIDCVVLEMDDNQAKKATIAMNNIKGYMQDMQLAALIEQLSKDNSLEELSKSLAFEEKELSNYLKLLETPEDFSELVKQPEDQSVTITFVVSVKKEKVIQKALDKTGLDSKSQALATICQKYLKEEKE